MVLGILEAHLSAVNILARSPLGGKTVFKMRKLVGINWETSSRAITAFD